VNLYCPQCFVLDTSSSDVTLTIQNCGYYLGLDQSAAGMVKFQFVNTGANLGKITDETNTYTVGPYGSGMSRTTCVCTNSHKFMCDAPTGGSTDGLASFPVALSVASYLKMGDYVRLNDKRLDFSTDANTYAQYTSSAIAFYSSSNRKMTMSSSAGILHGTWSSDGVITSSDARLKRSIEPLQETLAALQRAHAGGGSESQPATDEPLDPVAWLLMQLRPVSYIFKSDETGGRRFGFLADDIEKLIPDMVRLDNDTKQTKRLYILDMLAVLVASSQHQRAAFGALEARLLAHTRATEERFATLEAQVTTLAAELARCTSTHTMSAAASAAASSTEAEVDV